MKCRHGYKNNATNCHANIKGICDIDDKQCSTIKNKHNKYAVTFCDTPESIIIYAYDIDQAKILAQAKRIEQEKNYTDIYSIQELEQC